jgi:DNA-binding NarL/FixJ family response regulator
MPHLSTASKPTRVFLIEDHSIVSTVLAEILNRSGDFTVVGVAGNGTEALEKLATVAADFVIVDLMLPGMSGIEVIQAIRRRFRSLEIIVCSGVDAKPALETALRIGAQAFVEKNSRVEDLLSALRAVVKGEFPLSVGVAARVREIVHQRNSMKPLGRSDLAILRRLARRRQRQGGRGGLGREPVHDLQGASSHRPAHRRYRLLGSPRGGGRPRPVARCVRAGP